MRNEAALHLIIIVLVMLSGRISAREVHPDSVASVTLPLERFAPVKMRTDSTSAYSLQPERLLSALQLPDSVIRLYLHHDVKRRNILLWVIPNMYQVAYGERQYDIVTEEGFSAMPTLKTLATPSLYSETLYPGELLSPFHAKNRGVYRYQQSPPTPDSLAYLKFRPLFGRHTQLVRGAALLDLRTGKVLKASFKGEHDLFSFETELAYEGQRDGDFARTSTKTTFKFLGNRIESRLDARYEPKVLPKKEAAEDSRPKDSLDSDTLRSDSASDETRRKENIWDRHARYFERVWRHLAGSHELESKRTYVRIWPIFDPSYMSYSPSKGLSYNLRMGFVYRFKKGGNVSLTPEIGYNFKYKQMFYMLPLRYTYNEKRDGYVELVAGNSNRIGNGTIARDMELLSEQLGPDSTLHLPDDYNLYDDNYLTLTHNVRLSPHVDWTVGAVFHHRRAIRKDYVLQWGYDTEYNSFAPSTKLTFIPWRSDESPVLTVNYERSVKGVLGSNIEYERWEGDVSWKHKMGALRTLNLRFGGGVYSRKQFNHFTDFSNFHDNYLPGGWGDDWSGEFQLLDSRYYNESNHYVRANGSYESPFMVASWIPMVGRFVANERFYLNTLLSGKAHPYTEVGYGFTTRWMTVGLFASFVKLRYESFEAKFTVELFRHW